MKRKMKLNNEEATVLISGIVGFALMLLLTSCATNSIMACDSYIGPERDKCMEDYRVREAAARRTESMDSHPQNR